MKLLNFVPEPIPTHRADVTALFGRYLPSLGIHSHLIGMPGKGEPGLESFATIQTSTATGGRLRREWSYFTLCLRAMIFTTQDDFDVIQVRDMVPIGLLGLCIARLRGKPFVYWMSYLMSEERIRRASDKLASNISFQERLRTHLVLLKGQVECWLLYRVLLPQATHVFVQSVSMMNHVIQKGIQKCRQTTVPMGVDLEQLQTMNLKPVRLPGWEDCPVIAYLGTLDRSRQIEHLVEVLGRVRALSPNARLLLIGDALEPNDVKNIYARSVALGLREVVHITGWLPANLALPLLLGATVAVSYIPRGDILDTGSPTKLIEYLALGVPCVGNDNPDQATVLIESGAGILTDSAASSLAKAIASAINDPSAAMACALAGPAYVAQTRSYLIIAATVSKAYGTLKCAK